MKKLLLIVFLFIGFSAYSQVQKFNKKTIFEDSASMKVISFPDGSSMNSAASTDTVQASDIYNNSNVPGPKVNDALNNLNNELKGYDTTYLNNTNDTGNILVLSRLEADTAKTQILLDKTSNKVILDWNPTNHNIAIGSSTALPDISTNYNIYIGDSSGYNSTGGNYNNMIGRFTGKNNRGDHNVFIGDEVGNNNTTGSRNTFIGTLAGYNNTSANNNTFIGRGAGYSNTDGANNTIIGCAGWNFDGGDFNTIIGYNAGYVATGNKNLFLGYNAGYTNQTGNNNVFLGNTAGSWELTSNKLYIESGESKDSTETLIYGDFERDILWLNGDVTIKNDAPAQGSLKLNNGATINEFKTTISDNDIHVPTSGAVVDYVADNYLSLSGGTLSGTLTAAKLQLSNLNTAPFAASDTGTKGEIRITATAIFICIDTNTWVKADLATW